MDKEIGNVTKSISEGIQKTDEKIVNIKNKKMKFIAGQSLFL
jgi:hypothetical protein